MRKQWFDTFNLEKRKRLWNVEKNGSYVIGIIAKGGVFGELSYVNKIDDQSVL